MAMTAQNDIPAMKDRSNVAALVLVLEAIVGAIAKNHLAALNADAQAAFKADIAKNLDSITNEVIVQAPVTGRGASLAPAAARKAASRIQQDAPGLLADYLADLFPPPAK